MNTRIRNHMLGLLALTLPLAACAQQPSPSNATATPAATAASPSSPPPKEIVGLPDFTGLVEQVGPAVVNVESVISRKGMEQREGMPADDQQQIPDFFRHFFGPDFQMPGQQRGPSQDDNAPAGKSLGSGFIISSDGYVLTNHHVIAGATSVTVKLADSREFKAKVVGSDEQYDVALLKIDAKNLPVVRIGDSSKLKPGQWVVAIGSPFGLDHSVTAGIVSATARANPYADQRYVKFIQTDVAINQGNSGGPLLDTRGQVVGINSQIFSASGGYMGISFSIPIDLAMNAVQQIKKTGHVTRGQLGVIIGPIDSLKAQGLGLPDSHGALVSQLPEGSAAGKAGIEVGDVIRSVNGKKIGQATDLPPIIGMMQPGTKVKLGVWRDGKEREYTVTLTTLDTDKQAANDDDGGSNAEGPVSARLLGIEVTDLDQQDRDQLGLKKGEGVGIVNVTGASAREARLTRGLAILRVGRKPVGSVAELNKELARYKKGDVVMLLVTNGDATSFVAIRAGE